MRVPLRPRGEHGIAAIIVAITTTVLIGFLAFVTDFGLAYTNKRGLQNGADAAALAVAQHVAVNGSPTATCAQLEATWQAPGQLLADDYFDRNHAANGTIDNFELACTGTGGTQLTVTVDAIQDSPTFFGGVLGAGDDVALAQSATAVVAPPENVVRARPFSVCQIDAQLVAANPTVNQTISFDHADSNCGWPPGNWGVLDFADVTPNDFDDFIDWLTNGYADPVSLTTTTSVNGEPGYPSPVPGAFETAMNSLLDKEIVVLVHDSGTGTGTNSYFNTVGFLSVKVCGWKFNGQNGQSTTCFVPPASPAPRGYIQVKHAAFVPIGEVAELCAFSTSCDSGTRLFELVD